MTIAELKEKIADLPDEAEIMAEDFGGEPTEIFSLKPLENGSFVLLLS